MTFDETLRQIVPPRSQHTHIDAICKAMDVSRPRDKTDIEKILIRVAENAPARGMIIVVSDLLVDREPLFRGLEMLRHNRHDVLVFHVMDQDELTFPFNGTTRFEGMEDLSHVLCEPRALRDAYLEVLSAGNISSRCARLRPARRLTTCWYRPTNTWTPCCRKFLHHREAMIKSPAKT